MMIAMMVLIDLSKQQALDVDPRAMEQINFTEKLENQSKMFFFINEAKKTVSYHLQGTGKVF